MGDKRVMFFYLLKFLRASLRRERAQFELHFILLLRAVAVGAVIFLVPRIYRVRVVEVFLCELIEIVIKAGELSSKRLQSDGAVYDLKMMIMMMMMLMMLMIMTSSLP